MHEVAAECGEEEGEEASPLLTAATTTTTTTTPGGGGGEGEVQNNNGALGGGNVNNGEEVELGSLQRTVNMFSRRLLRFSTTTKLSMSSVSGATYLQQKLSTVEGTDEVYAQLQARVESPQFLEDMKASLATNPSGGGGGGGGNGGGNGEDDDDGEVEFNIDNPVFWGEEEEEATSSISSASVAVAATVLAPAPAPAPASDLAAATTGPPASGAADDEEGYVMVEKEDVIDALAAFIAAYIAAHPRASCMPPEKLQLALGSTFGELRHGGGGGEEGGEKGQVRRLWDWGLSVYRGVSWTYGTVSAFTNPWVARLLLAAVYTSARITCGVAAAIV